MDKDIKNKENMSSRKLRFALFGNIYQAKKSASIQKVLSCLIERKADVYIEKEYYHFLTDTQHLDVDATGIFEDDDFDVDFVISMGGDGTFLKTAGHVGDKGFPMLGVNMGRLGFLADVSPKDIEKCLDAIYKGEYSIEDRAVIKVETDGEPIEGCCFALNDIAVLKRDNASMISIRVTINGEYLVTYQADGIVVSTPTGSTAYSLSNGGPILIPQSAIMSLTAVAPHSLNIRPIVIPDDSEVCLAVESRSHNFLIAVDGRSEKCKEGTKLTLRKAPYNIKIVKRNGCSYYHTLREKLMWGVDTRR